MDNNKTIDKYIATEMGGKIVRKKEAPVAGLLLLMAGAVLLVLIRSIALPDSLQAATLTVGILGLAVGLVLTAMSLSGAMWHYKYLPTGSRLKDKKVYLGLTDYQKALDALVLGNKGGLAGLHSVTSSNSALRVLVSKDGAVALVQAGRYDTGHFEVESPVVCLFGTEVAAIELLCR